MLEIACDMANCVDCDQTEQSGHCLHCFLDAVLSQSFVQWDITVEIPYSLFHRV